MNAPSLPSTTSPATFLRAVAAAVGSAPLAAALESLAVHVGAQSALADARARVTVWRVGPRTYARLAAREALSVDHFGRCPYEVADALEHELAWLQHCDRLAQYSRGSKHAAYRRALAEAEREIDRIWHAA
jgi:hypothetical protein